MMFWFSVKVGQKIGSHKQHINPFHSLTNLYFCVLKVEWIFEAMERAEILFERPNFSIDFYKVSNYFPVKCPAFFPTILNLSVYVQYFPRQPRPTHPRFAFLVLQKHSQPSICCYWLS